jgi:hypothetical protein
MVHLGLCLFQLDDSQTLAFVVKKVFMHAGFIITRVLTRLPLQALQDS